ncbi:MAG: cation transporter [bacterium]|nr:cation transporter [bacterium]
MGHGHHHHHVDEETSTARLFITMTLNFIFTIVELIGGIVSGSLSLLSDALHNFSDGIAIIISYIAIRLGKAEKTHKYTFGLKRAEILAAVINAGTLIAICIYLFKESYDRLVAPEDIKGGTMIIVASVGLVANIVGTLLLKKGSHGNINIRSAYLHLLSDAVSSAAVIVGGIFIYYYKIYWIDPVLTNLISLYILIKSFEILKEALEVLMMGAPQSVSIEGIQEDLENIPGINSIHHIHLWRLGEKDIHFEAHIDVEDMKVSETTPLSAIVEDKLKHRGVSHITLQFENGKCNPKGHEKKKKAVIFL